MSNVDSLLPKPATKEDRMDKKQILTIGSMQGNKLFYKNFRVFVLPHMQKRHKGGEDAAVLTDRVLAVADGVGGWAENGVDPANYSRRLC
jgi:hypothetical protein